MNLTELQKKMFAVARANPPSDHVPYAFEKRIMARLHAPLPLDLWALWGRLLWRAAAPCVAIMVLLSAWTLVNRQLMDPADQLAVALENSVQLAVDHFSDDR